MKKSSDQRSALSSQPKARQKTEEQTSKPTPRECKRRYRVCRGGSRTARVAAQDQRIAPKQRTAKTGSGGGVVFGLASSLSRPLLFRYPEQYLRAVGIRHVDRMPQVECVDLGDFVFDGFGFAVVKTQDQPPVVPYAL